MKILTCNIRYLGAEDGDNGWKYRKDFCAEIIKSQSADMICFQEVWKQQFEDLHRALPGYQTFGMADVPQGRNPQNCIFYRKNKFNFISSGGYWLSETPHVPGSRSWDSACIRLANWIRLEVLNTKTEFRIVNTHLDHVAQEARENQARIIVEDTKAYQEDYPQILTGDMNCDFSNKAIKVFKSGGWIDTFEAVHGNGNPGHTYHEFKGSECVSDIGKMDWIFMRGKIRATDAEVIKDCRNGKFPSDHYFVSATVDLL
ncbi:MAG TPA: endonuclease [Lentisphaeria bacterium]|nr:endonuclease [Lentisphaeria bacterium]